MMLNEFSFFDTVKANDYLLVYFYKDRCKPCEDAAPEFKKATQ